MKLPTETALVRQCLDWLALHGVFAWRNNTTGVYDPARKVFRKFTGLKGVSDILGILPPTGRLLALECKRHGRHPTAEQQAFLDAVARCGGLALCVTSLDDLIEGLHFGEGLTA